MPARKFSEGDRVRVVSADPISGDTRFVGKTGVVTQVGEVDLGYDYLVMILDEAIAWPFVGSELATVNVKVVEGGVGSYNGRRFVGDISVDETLDTVEDGDEVRITVETIRKGGESK